MTADHRPEGRIVLYQAEDRGGRIRVLLEGETVWLTQALIAELFQTTPQNITMHLAAIYAEGKLAEPATCKEYLQVRTEGRRQVERALKHYNLEAILAGDYREGEEETQRFFATMQNKVHYAATGMTAAEIIRRRADFEKTNMGLTSWKGGRVLKRDVGTAKNYLGAAEIDTLNRITVMFLDQAEFRAQRRQDLRMRDWDAFLDKFLRDTELPVLDGSGEVSHEGALDWANRQYDAFSERRRLAAEAEAESRYLGDLQISAKALDIGRGKPKGPAKREKNAKSARKPRGGGDK